MQLTAYLCLAFSGIWRTKIIQYKINPCLEAVMMRLYYKKYWELEVGWALLDAQGENVE